MDRKDEVVDGVVTSVTIVNGGSGYWPPQRVGENRPLVQICDSALVVPEIVPGRIFWMGPYCWMWTPAEPDLLSVTRAVARGG